MFGAQSSGAALLRNPMVGSFGACACAVQGHAKAALPRRVMNSRRRMVAPSADELILPYLRSEWCSAENGTVRCPKWVVHVILGALARCPFFPR
jgi:hypothetical protein